MNRLSSLPNRKILILAKCLYVQKWWFRWSQCVVECTLSVYARPTGTTLARYHFNVLAVYPQTRCRFNPDTCVSFFGVEREFFRPDPAFRVLSAPIHQIYRMWTYNTGCTMSLNSTHTPKFISNLWLRIIGKSKNLTAAKFVWAMANHKKWMWVTGVSWWFFKF